MPDDLLDSISLIARTHLLKHNHHTPTIAVKQDGEVSVFVLDVDITDQTTKTQIRDLIETQVRDGAETVIFVSEAWQGNGPSAQEYVKSGRKLASWAYRQEVLVIAAASPLGLTGQVYSIERDGENNVVQLHPQPTPKRFYSPLLDRLPWSNEHDN